MKSLFEERVIKPICWSIEDNKKITGLGKKYTDGQY